MSKQRVVFVQCACRSRRASVCFSSGGQSFCGGCGAVLVVQPSVASGGWVVFAFAAFYLLALFL